MTNEEAIKTLKETLYDEKTSKNYLEAVRMARESLENQKTGYWIKHEKPNLGKCMKITYECSNCKVWVGCEYFIRKSYCPNCGAKMQEVEE